MATPNIVDVATINGFTVAGQLTTNTADVIDVPAEYTYKINTIIIANWHGSVTREVNAWISTDNGSNYKEIASAVSIPSDATLILIDKSSSFYLDETDILRLEAGNNDALDYIISGEKLTD